MKSLAIKYINPTNSKEMIQKADELTDEAGNVVHFENGVWKFENDDNYTESFGFQWNKFEKTQIDRFNESIEQSKERFFAVTGWESEDLSGKNVLEVGSGAGRFSQVVLQHTKATLYSVDYSRATEANFRNNGPDDRLKLFQASIYTLPFSPMQFDKVFCFGVLQHTPDFKKSVAALANMVKPGGELIVDFYPIRGWYTKIHSKYLLRPFTKKMSHEKLLSLIENNVDRLIGIYHFLNKVGLHFLTRFIPICDIKNTLPQKLTKEELRNWVILDTFDMFSPQHDHPQKLETVKKWCQEYGLKVYFADFIKVGNNKIAVVKALRE